MDTTEVKTNSKEEADNSAGLLQLDQRSTTASSEEDRLAAGTSTIGLQARKLSGAQRKKLIRVRKMREEIWTESKPPRKIPSSGDPSCRFCGRNAERVLHIICCCEASARPRYNVFGSLVVEPTDMRTVSVRDLCLFIRGMGLWSLS
jgi:hypothetical protein